MPRRYWTVACALACVAGMSVAPAMAEMLTSIDLDYTYNQDNNAGDVHATASYHQKYEIQYLTSLTSAYDFMGAVRLELADSWSTKDPTSSGITPSLEMSVRGSGVSLTAIYTGSINTTEQFHESGETTMYANSFTSTLALTPDVLPEMTLRYARARNYQPWVSDGGTETIEFATSKDISVLRLGFNLSNSRTWTGLPSDTGSDAITWSGRASYKEKLWGGTDFDLAYEIRESYSESFEGNVFSALSEDYNQSLRSRLKNTLTLAPRMTLGLSWDYQFDQNLLALSYDYKLKNKYLLELRWDLLSWLKIAGETRRETDTTIAKLGEEDTQAVSDTAKAGFDMAPVEWFRVSGRAEFKRSEKEKARSGASVDLTEDERYELSAKQTYGEFWDLTLSASTATSHVDGWVTSRDTKLRGELRLRLFDLSVTPSYEVGRTNTWTWGEDVPNSQRRLQDAKVDISYMIKLLDLFQAMFTHQYGVTVEDSLDEFLNFESRLQFSESTRINIQIAEFVRDLKLHGEAERKGSDTEHDAEPELVEVAYRLRLDWRLDELSLGASLSYSDKGNAYDDLSANTRISWQSDQLDMAGEYQIEKIFAEQASERRKLNLRLSYKF